MTGTARAFSLGWVFAGCLVLSTPATVAAQNVLTAGNGSGFPGDAVEITITLDNDVVLLGFQLGLSHDDTVVTLDDIRQGTLLQDLNGGDGPAFWDFDVDPEGGPGGWVAAITSFAPPLDEIPIDTGHELVIYDYSVVLTADAGSTSDLDFVDTLGSPDIETGLSDGDTIVPDVESGSVLVETLPVEDLLCELTDPCECEYTLTWTNAATYDSIGVYLDGELLESIDGGVETYTASLDAPSSAEFSVLPTALGTDGAETICAVECVEVSAPDAPDDLTCVVDDELCEVTATWTNPETYAAIDVLVDGEVVETLAGDAETVVVTVTDPGDHELSLEGTNDCLSPFETVSCTFDCPFEFQRGDANDTGNLDISDPIKLLIYLFAEGTLVCEKAADANDNGELTLGDALEIIAYLFQEGPDLAAPFLECGSDPVSDDLTCSASETCP